MLDPYDNTHRGPMGDSYSYRRPISRNEGQSIVPVVIGLGLVVGLLALALFFGTAGEPAPQTPAQTGITQPASPGQ